MRHSMAWPRGVSARAGSMSSRSPQRDADLPLHQVDFGDHLGDRVLDLEPRVHLEEIERAVLVEQELDGARVGVVHRPGHRGGGRGHALAQRLAHGERRRFLDHFLMAPLNRALALDERHDGAMMVAEQLDLDVPRARQPPLEVDRGIAERRPGLRSRGLHGRGEGIGRFDHPHALAAAAGDRLHHQRIADLRRRGRDLIRARRPVERPSRCLGRRELQPRSRRSAPRSCCP